ncbi:ABC transporter permease [Thermodesulfobacterium hydrogeniphilum]|uniref:ABC transporter permease n=1 Tax=Thermodesulfobacterium hydrogeniphilum TaxID=161156 RepID=UPI00056F53CC|nr:ABC transporter permease [Thermodesulfobacterium hydrogeniphilum]
MKFLYIQILKDVWKELISNKVNLFFMILSLVISLTALNTIYSLGYSAKEQILNALANVQFGKDAMLILAGGGKIIGLTTTRRDTLKLGDAKEIEKLDFVKLVSPISLGTSEVSYKGNAEMIRIEGVFPNYTIATNWYPKTGRFINKNDLKRLSKVCVVGFDIPKKFGIKDPIGKKIKIRSEYFEIIGILESKPTFGHFNRNERIFIPLTTAQRRLFNKDYIDAIKILFQPGTNIDLAKYKIRQILRKRHKLYGIEPDDFRIITPDMAIKFFTSASKILTIFLLTISLISLIISGVIIMNLMYANIEEKSPIIALRVALGATSQRIIIHYLVMSLIIAFISGLIGWILSLLILKTIAYFTPLKAYFSWLTFLFSLSFAILTTIVFSLIPSVKATQVEPSILLKSL